MTIGFLKQSSLYKYIATALSDVDSILAQLKPVQGKPLVQYMHREEFPTLINMGLPVSMLPDGDPVHLVGFTKETLRVILTATLQGQTIRTACRLAGIKVAQLNRWLEMADRNIEPYVSFQRELERAQALYEAKLVDLANEHITDKRNSKLLQWILEKRGTEDWAPELPQAAASVTVNNVSYHGDRPLSEMSPMERYEHIQQLKPLVSKAEILAAIKSGNLVDSDSIPELKDS